MIRNDEPGRVESVHRALVLLKLMAAQGSLSVTEAARALDVNPSTAQRLLVTLVGDDFAVQGEHKRYEPGPAYPRPAGSGSVPSLRARMRPFLERLFERVEETSHLAVLVGTEIHHLDGIEAVHTLRFGLRTGVRLPAHRTSAGKAMLASLPEHEVDARYTAAARDERSVVDLEVLHRELAATRRDRIGSNFEESEPGVAAFAVALGAVEGEIAALSIAMPVARYAHGDKERFAAQLLRTAEEARRALLP